MVAGETKSIERTPSCYTCGQNQRHGEIDLTVVQRCGEVFAKFTRIEWEPHGCTVSPWGCVCARQPVRLKYGRQ